ncbi:MAG TPA: tetratricopeptide repeat protein [Allosphingosinicella sp.]
MAVSRALRTLLLSAVLAAPATALIAAATGGSGVSSSPSMSAPQFDAAAEYRKGIEALQAQRFTEAKRSFGRVLGVAPGDANTNYLAGMADAGLNDLKNARKHFEKAVKADRNMVLARRELALTYVKLGERAKAEAELAALTALQSECAGNCPKAAELTASVAAVQAALASAPSARLETRPSLLFASASGGDHAYLDAVGLINEGRYEEAIASLQAARAAFGAHPDILTYLGFANRKVGRFETAETYYRAALAAAPRHRGATEYYGELMVERGDLEGAETMLARLETICDFGCAEADELRRWIESGRAPAS